MKYANKLTYYICAIIFPIAAIAAPDKTPQMGYETGATYPLQYKIGTTWNPLQIMSTPIYVYIDNYGAAGNGITDDSTPLNDAISALGTKGGTVILSCSKNYYIGNNVTVKPNVTIKHCRGAGYHGNPASPTSSNAISTQPHVKLSPSASFTMEGNSGYEGIIFNSTLTFPVANPSGYSGTAIYSKPSGADDVTIDALVVGFAKCFDGSGGGSRYRINLECDANPSVGTGGIIFANSFDSSNFMARSWPWGTYGNPSPINIRSGYGIYITGIQDDSSFDLLDYGHEIGVYNNANGNITYNKIWTDNNSSYGFYANNGDRITITNLWIYSSLGTRFDAAGTWNIGYFLCDTATVAGAGCLGLNGAATINVGTFYVIKSDSYAINIGNLGASVNLGSSTILNSHGGVAPYIAGISGWNLTQIQFGTPAKTDIPNGNSFLGGNQITIPSVASANNVLNPVTYDDFYVTGTADIYNFGSANGGKRITAHFKDVLTVKNNTYIALANSQDFVTANGYALTLEYDSAGLVWREISRSPSSASALSDGVSGSGNIVLKNSPSIDAATINMLSGSYVGPGPGAAGTCSTGAYVGGTMAGKFSVTNGGGCAIGTTIVLSFNAAVVAANGFACDAHDQTLPASRIEQIGSNTSSATFVVVNDINNGDVISYKCVGY